MIEKEIKNDWWKRDWIFWLMLIIFGLGLILLIKMLITGEPS